MRKGTGKIEVIACRGEIRTLLQQGYAVSVIYSRLSEENKLTIGWRQFYRHVRKLVLPLVNAGAQPVANAGRSEAMLAQATPSQSTSSASAPILRRLDWDPSRKIDY